MESNFRTEFFRANRERLKTLFAGTAPIVLTANGLLQRNNDTTYPFRQDSNFWYLTGINEPDIILVLDKGKEYLIVPGRSETRAAFDGAVTMDELSKRSAITQVLSEKEGWQLLKTRLKKVQHVATLAAPKSHIESLGIYTNPARRRLVAELKRHNAQLELLDLRPHLTKMRSIKQRPELAAIQQAIDLSVKAFSKVSRDHFSKYSYEYEVEAALTNEFRKHNANHAYQPIVASGQHACTLHYITNDGALEATGMLLIDAGAEIENYAADITRSYCLKKPSARQQAVYDAVLSVQHQAISLLKPGALLIDYEQAIEQFMGEKLRELGLIKTIDRSNVRHYYPHATSHFLGLDVHDVGDYQKPLEPGMVLTVEPGIYIPEEGLGIRIEDNILITDKSNKILSDKLPRQSF